jgi:hypothetical protein
VPSTLANTATGSARTSFSFEYSGEGRPEGAAGGESEAAFTAVRASSASQTLQPPSSSQGGNGPSMSLQQFHQQRLAAGGRSW